MGSYEITIDLKNSVTNSNLAKLFPKITKLVSAHIALLFFNKINIPAQERKKHIS